MSKIYDYNLFFSSSDPEEDRILRISPAIKAVYKSSLLNLEAQYSYDDERYDEHPELDSDRARQSTSMSGFFTPDRTTSYSIVARHLKTKTPSEISPELGLQLGRTKAERLTFSPMVRYSIDHKRDTTFSYNYQQEEISSIENDAHRVTMILDVTKDRRNTNHYRSEVEHFEFDNGDTISALILSAGRTYRYTERTRFKVEAGGWISDESVEPEIRASAFHRLQVGELNGEYALRETVLLGLLDTATTQSLAATFRYMLMSDLEFRISTGVNSTSYQSSDTRVYNMTLEAGYRINRYTTLTGSFDYAMQEGGITETAVGDEIDRRLASITLVFAIPERNESGMRPLQSISTMPGSMTSDGQKESNLSSPNTEEEQ